MTHTHPPFFIVGSARSGTTFLRLTMNAHPEIAVPPESRFVTELHAGDEVDVDDFLERLEHHKRFEAWELPIEAVKRELGDARTMSYADAIDAVYRAYAKAHDKERWGDKTPRYIERIGEIAELFPDARFIHLIRDGREVALSYADVPFGPKTVAKAARLWAQRVAAGIRQGRALEKGRYLEVMYHDLIEDTEGEVKDICAFVGVAFDPVMLDRERTREGALSRSEKYNPNVHRAARKTRSWRTDMPPQDIEIFEVVAGDVLSELGFERLYPEPGAMARIKGALGTWGLPVAKLRRHAEPSA